MDSKLVDLMLLNGKGTNRMYMTDIISLSEWKGN
jgi:hypothetical protein